MDDTAKGVVRHGYAADTPFIPLDETLMRVATLSRRWQTPVNGDVLPSFCHRSSRQDRQCNHSDTELNLQTVNGGWFMRY